jgi:hypothetical protein
MSYTPKAQGNTKSDSGYSKTAPNGEAYKFPVPDAGNQSARISLIVDIGTQEREDFVDPTTKVVTPQKPCQQVVVFADLVDQVVDYGGDIGEKQYRLMLNKNFRGDIQGINFTAVPPRDAEGKLIEGKNWTFHPQNLLTKIAKASGNEHILGTDPNNNMNINELLGAAFYADVEVTSTPDKNGKKDSSGNVIVYNNVNFKGASKLPMVKGKPVEVEELSATPLILNHNNVTKETVIFLRGKVISIMKAAPEYEGSVLQSLLESADTPKPEKAEKPATEKADKPAPKKAEPKKAEPKVEEPIEDYDESIPF